MNDGINSIQKTTLICFLAMVVGLKAFSQADDSKLALSGYLKYLQTTTFYQDSALPATTINLLHNRLNFRWYPSEYWTVAVEARNRLFYGEEVKLAPILFNSRYGKIIDQPTGLVDMSVLWLDQGSVVLHSIVDRAYVNYSKDKWDIRVGRQRINWGINLAWNPNDLFNALNFLDFDYEERPGSDAIRVTYYPGMMSSTEIAFAPGRNIEESVGAAMYKFNLKGYDVQLLGGYARGDIALGAGWAGNLKTAGFKGEATWFLPTEYSSDSVNSLSLSMSVDYLFSNSLYLSGGVLYNSLGESGILSLQSGLAAATLSPKNLFPGKWATLAQVSGPVTPLFNVSGAFIYSPTDNITVFFPTLTYSIKENWDIDLIGQAFLADTPDGYSHIATAAFFRLKWSY